MRATLQICRLAAAVFALPALIVGYALSGHVPAAQAAGLIRPHGTPSTPAPYPFQDGDAWLLTVSGTETIVTPSAPPTTVPYAYTQADLEACPVTFDSVANLCAQQETQTNQPGYAGTFYLGYVADGALAKFVQYGGSSSSSGGGSTSSAIWTFTPAALDYVFPAKAGRRISGWDSDYREDDLSYGPDRSTSTSNLDLTRTGTYHVIDTSDQPKQHTKSHSRGIVASDGSAQYDATVSGPSAATLSETFGAPALVGSSWVIPVTTVADGSSTSVNVPDWFPGGGPTPKRLIEIPVVDEGSVTMPAQCGPYAGQAAEDYRISNDYELDPLAGWLETYASDTYFVNGIGAACEIEAYTNAYYDNTNTGSLEVAYEYADTQILENFTTDDALLRHNLVLDGKAHGSGPLSHHRIGLPASPGARIPSGAARWLQGHGVTLPQQRIAL
jgi:hypothetical protein